MANRSSSPALRDAGLVVFGLALEHYKMARYGAIIAEPKAVGTAM